MNRDPEGISELCFCQIKDRVGIFQACLGCCHYSFKPALANFILTQSHCFGRTYS